MTRASKKIVAIIDPHYLLLDGGAKSEMMTKDAALADAAGMHACSGEYVAVCTEDGKVVKTYKTKVPKAAKAEPAPKAEKPVKAPKEPKAPKVKAEKIEKKIDPESGVGKVIALACRDVGTTTKELAQATGWENAGWNTIMANIAKRHGYTAIVSKRDVEGSKRVVNVFSFVPVAPVA